MNELDLFIFGNLRLSFSSLSTFTTCNYGWYLTYMEAKEREENFFSQYGKFFHKIFELYWKNELEQFELADYYAKHYSENVFLSPPPYPVGMGDKYYSDGLEFFQDIDLNRECYEVLCLESEIKSVHRKINLVIKPDLIIKDKETGKVILMDYKTAKPMKGKKLDANKIAEYEKQMFLYAYFFEKEFGIKVDEIVLLFPRLPEHTFYKVEITEEKLKAAVRWFSTTVGKIKKTNTFNANPDKYFCSHICSVRSHCEKK